MPHRNACLFSYSPTAAPPLFHRPAHRPQVFHPLIAMRIRNHPTAHLLLAIAFVAALGTAQAAAQRVYLDVPLADVNADAAAENLLIQARGLAANGAYNRAANLYASLAERQIATVTESADLHHLSIHLAANRDLLAWPAEALADYRRQTEPHAQQLLELALHTGDLAAIESVATRYMATPAGAKAMAVLAVRLLEQGDFVLIPGSTAPSHNVTF